MSENYTREELLALRAWMTKHHKPERGVVERLIATALAAMERADAAVLIGRPAEYRGTTLQAIKGGTPLSRGRITTVWPDGRLDVAMENGSTITGPRDQFIVAAASEDSHE